MAKRSTSGNVYLKALATNYVGPSDVSEVPVTLLPRLRGDAPLGMPAGTVVTCTREQADRLLQRNTVRPKWEDVTRQVESGLTEPTAPKGEAAGETRSARNGRTSRARSSRA